MNGLALAASHVRAMLAAPELLLGSGLLAAGLVVTTALVLHESPEAALVANGVFWPVIVFTGVHATTRGLSRDADAGGLTGTLLLPVPRSTLVLSRAAANALALLALSLLVLGIVQAILPPSAPVLSGQMVVVAALAAAGISVVATVGAYASLGTTARDLVGPALAVPLLLPVLIAAVHAAAALLAGGPSDDVRSNIIFLAGYDVLLFGMTVLVADALVEGA